MHAKLQLIIKYMLFHQPMSYFITPISQHKSFQFGLGNRYSTFLMKPHLRAKNCVFNLPNPPLVQNPFLTTFNFHSFIALK